MKTKALSLLALSLLAAGAAIAGPSNPGSAFSSGSKGATGNTEMSQKTTPAGKSCHQAAKATNADGSKCQSSSTSCSMMKHS